MVVLNKYKVSLEAMFVEQKLPKFLIKGHMYACKRLSYSLWCIFSAENKSKFIEVNEK